MNLNYHITIKLINGNVKRFYLQFNEKFDYLFWLRTTTNRGNKILKIKKI